MDSGINRSKSTPRKVKALLSSFIHGSPSDNDEQCSINCEVKSPTILPCDEVDGWRKKDDASGDHKKVFQPDNKAAFYDRVQTYAPFTWFDPLTTLNPLECSRYGWKNIDTNTLKCVSCKEVLYAGSPENMTFEQDCDIRKNMIQLIKTAHSSICPWPTSPSSEKFYIVVETTPKSTTSEFYKRLQSILTQKDCLPKLDLDFIASEDTDFADVTNTVHKIASELQKTGQEEEEISAAGFLALFGWTNSELEGSSIIVCNHCKRQAGLWNFTSLKEKQKANGETTGAGSVEPEPKKRKLMDLQLKTFNPSTEHRNWCPWISTINTSTADIQTPSGENKSVNTTAGADSDDQVIKQMLELVDPTASGWMQVLQMLRRNLEPSEVTRPTLANTTPPSQAWKTVKRILGFFQGKSKHDT